MDKPNFERVCMCPVRQIPSHLLWTYRELDTPYEVNLIHKDAMLSSDMLIDQSLQNLNVFYYQLLFQQSISCIKALFA